MAVNADYPRPITVNGYVCRNCADVSKAKRFIDPTVSPLGPQPTDKAVSFGGSLADRIPVSPSQPALQLVDRLA